MALASCSGWQGCVVSARGLAPGVVGVSVSLLSRPRPAVVLDMAFISVGDLGSDRAQSIAGRMN